MKRTELVPIGVPNIRQMHCTHLALARAWRAFDRRSTVRNGNIMELPHLLGRTALEPNGATVGEGSDLTVYGLADAERSTIVPIEKPGLTCARRVLHHLTCPKHAKDSVIKTPGSLDVVRSDHDMTEHDCLSG